jgi:transposase
VDAIFYVVDNGIKWRALPVDFPPWSTVYTTSLPGRRRGSSQTEMIVRWSLYVRDQHARDYDLRRAYQGCSLTP